MGTSSHSALHRGMDKGGQEDGNDGARPHIHMSLALPTDEEGRSRQQALDQGLDITFLRSAADWERELPRAEFLLVGRPRRMDWSAATKLQLLHVAGAGVDPLLPADGLPPSVIIANCRDTHADAVRDHVVAMMLAFARDVPRVLDRQQRRQWRPFPSEPLTGKRLTLLGLGSIGSRVARVAHALGMQVTGVCCTPRQVEGVTRVLPSTELEAAMTDADYFVICLPLTSRTQGLVSAEALSALPAGAFVINVSRGGILDEEALEEALGTGDIGGAALDVFAQEPLPRSSSLWSCPNLIATPHIAGWTPNYVEQILASFLLNVKRMLSGEPPTGVVSRTREY